MDELTTIAIVTYRIPDLSDAAKRAVLPQSQHKPIAAQMLQGCVELADPLAVIHVMTAVYLSAIPTETAAREIASLIPRSKLPAYRKTLESLADKLNADALTLQGLFAQREGSVQRALDLFESATKNYKLGTRHPMQLPLIAPWNALGLLCETSPDANLRKTARAAFETGARSHDDPLSCAHFATFYDRTDKEWLQYTSKAAASGHRDSSAALALFYRDAAAPDSPLLASAPIQNALRWLTGWKEGSSERLAEEWAHVAADLGHKPSMLLLADWYEVRGERESARAMLHKAVEGDARTDEWPQLVPKARARLARLKV
jgi:TPR repeat protein